MNSGLDEWTGSVNHPRITNQLIRTLSFYLGIRAYEQLGLKAFGHGGKVVAAVIISIHNIGGKVSHFPVGSEGKTK